MSDDKPGGSPGGGSNSSNNTPGSKSRDDGTKGGIDKNRSILPKSVNRQEQRMAKRQREEKMLEMKQQKDAETREEKRRKKRESMAKTCKKAKQPQQGHRNQQLPEAVSNPLPSLDQDAIPPQAFSTKRQRKDATSSSQTSRRHCRLLEVPAPYNGQTTCTQNGIDDNGQEAWRNDGDRDLLLQNGNLLETHQHQIDDMISDRKAAEERLEEHQLHYEDNLDELEDIEDHIAALEDQRDIEASFHLESTNRVLDYGRSGIVGVTKAPGGGDDYESSTTTTSSSSSSSSSEDDDCNDDGAGDQDDSHYLINQSPSDSPRQVPNQQHHIDETRGDISGIHDELTEAGELSTNSPTRTLVPTLAIAPSTAPTAFANASTVADHNDVPAAVGPVSYSNSSNGSYLQNGNLTTQDNGPGNGMSKAPTASLITALPIENALKDNKAGAAAPDGSRDDDGDDSSDDDVDGTNAFNPDHYEADDPKNIPPKVL